MVRAFRCDGGWQPHLLSLHLAPAPWPPTAPSRGASRVEPAPPPSRPAAARPRPRAVAARPCRPRASRLAVVNGSADALARRVSGPRATVSRRALSLGGLAAPPLLPLSPAGSTRVGHQPEPPVPAPKRRRPVASCGAPVALPAALPNTLRAPTAAVCSAVCSATNAGWSPPLARPAGV